MTPAQSAFLERLAPVLPARAVSVDPTEIAPWLVDWRKRFFGAAPILLSPSSTEEVAAIVRAAGECGVALVPQGGNSSMVGGATPPADGSAVLLSLRRMNRIRHVDAAAGLVVAEAGVILSDLHDTAHGVGRRFPLTLGAKGSATVGGLVSTNAGGTQVLRFGTMRGLVAGVEAVLAGGVVHDGLAALKKDNRGYDPGQLLIGAEGTLGIVTAATLRIVPDVTARRVAWAGVATPDAAMALLRRADAMGAPVESFELLPDESLQAVLRHVPGARAPLSDAHPWHVLIEAAGDDEAADAVEALLAQGIADGSVADAVIAASEAQGAAFWRLRESISDAERATGPAVQHDIAVPVAAMPRFMVEAARSAEARFPGTRASGFGHLGDGNVHFHVRAPAGVEAAAWYRDAAPEITRFVHDLVVAAGGTISAEHGIGQMKIGEMARLGPPARLQALRAIKAAMDPDGIFNPGKLVPPA